MLIEDVACPVDKLGDMTQDLVDMFQKFGYKDASCFGHALEGNLHLVFSQVCSYHSACPCLSAHVQYFPVVCFMFVRALGSRCMLLSGLLSVPHALIAVAVIASCYGNCGRLLMVW